MSDRREIAEIVRGELLLDWDASALDKLQIRVAILEQEIEDQRKRNRAVADVLMVIGGMIIGGAVITAVNEQWGIAIALGVLFIRVTQLTMRLA